ncbi:MAG: hypothetical protein GX262_12315 [Clostridia bacterium]|jgi:hypothetical protein|nr:hypothetical protein [Clostridia bacterium]
MMGQNMDIFMGMFSYSSISLAIIKQILEILFYLAGIKLFFKGVKALDIYINKNNHWQ